ncbi:MAG: cobalamin-binding protein [Planctomycetes bacterium]|nr:cobalamin-binding protein [Planctomycetota bacterium]
MRIVSLVPSATEMICTLGLGDQLVGVTHECDYPDVVRSLPKVTRAAIPIDVSSAQIDAMVHESVGSGKSLFALDREKLVSLKPSLVITQSLCDVCAVDVLDVERAFCGLDGEPEILRLEPIRLADVLDGILTIGVAAGVEERANEVISALSDRILAVEGRIPKNRVPRRVVMLEWIDPLFCAGHWNPELVALAGGVDCLGRAGDRSHVVPWEAIQQANPEVMVITCCGYTIERTNEDLPILASKPRFKELDCVRNGQLYIMDGNAYFNRPGPRLIDSLEMLSHILHPDSSG